MPSRNKVSKLVKSVKSCIAKDNWENFQELISKLKKTGGQDELFDNGYLSAEKKPTKCTLLMYLAMQGHYEFVLLLLSPPNAADVTKRNACGESALYLALTSACRTPNYDLRIIDELLKHNPQQLILRNNFGCTPLFLCIEQQRFDLAEKLLSAQVSSQQQFSSAYEQQMLLQNSHGLTPLLVALKNGNFAIVKKLLQKMSDAQLSAVSKDGDTATSMAIQSGNLEQFQWLIETYPAIMTQITKRKSSVLTYACKIFGAYQQSDRTKSTNILEIIKIIMQRTNGSQVLVADTNRAIPLNIACYYDHSILASLLLTHSVNEQLNFPDPEGLTPIISACYYGNLTTLRTLIQHAGPSVVTKHLTKEINNGGCVTTALHLVITNATKISVPTQIEIIRIMLQYAPEQQLKKQNSIGRTALFLAIAEKQLDIARLLLSYEHSTQLEILAQGESLLYRVIANAQSVTGQEAWQNSLSIFKLLLDRSSKEQLAVPYLGRLPIHKACEIGFVQYANLLLEKDPQQVNAKIDDSYGSSPLHIAVFLGHKILVTLLFHHGVNNLQTNKYGIIPLHIACKGSCTEIIEILLQTNREQQLCYRTLLGNTPLHQAIGDNNIIAIEIFLKKTMNKEVLLEIRNNEGLNPLQLACALPNSLPTVKALISNGANIESMTEDTKMRPLHIACLRKNPDVVEYLLEHGAQVNVFNSHGYAPLHIATEQNDIDSARKIITRMKQQKLSVDTTEEEKLSALCIAVIFNHREIIESLLSAGADINWQQTIEGKIVTPLRLSIEKTCDAVTFKNLLDTGANPFQVFEEGKTIIDMIDSIEDKQLQTLFVLALLCNLEKQETIQQPQFIDFLQSVIIIRVPISTQTQGPIATVQSPQSCSNPMFFPQIPEQGQSGRAYLRRHGFYSDKQLREIALEVKKQKPGKPATKCRREDTLHETAPQQQIITWFNRQLSPQSRTVIPIVNHSGIDTYCYFPQQCLERQGYNLIENLGKLHLRFSSKSIKKLDDAKGVYEDMIHMPDGKTEKIKYTHEFKVNELDRILLFYLPSDNGKACLYIGSRFIPAGFHTQKQIMAVTQSCKHKREVMMIDLPTTLKKTPQPASATTTSPSIVPLQPKLFLSYAMENKFSKEWHKQLEQFGSRLVSKPWLIM